MTRASRVTAFLSACCLLLASCGGGGGSSPVQPGGATTPASVFSPPAAEALTTGEVERILAQATEEALARSKPAVIAVTDRVGNVLAVFAMTGAPSTLTIRSNDRAVTPTDIEGLVVGPSATANPLGAAAIAKAITGAYLSSSGNAFSTRTASQIVQQHFPPAPSTVGLESGPLFGVQFSQLPCSDLSARYMAAGGPAGMIGPKRSPLGLAADPGGMPIYKNGVVVGGIGVMSDGLYSYDANILDTDSDDDEFIALAGVTGFEAPRAIQADRISVDGTTLRYTDATSAGLLRSPAAARAFAALNGGIGVLARVRGYFAETGVPAIVAGTPYGSEASGIRAATSGERTAGTTINNLDAFILTDGSGATRYPIVAATDAGDVAQPLSAAEVKAVLEEAFVIAGKARGQIRIPLDSRAQVSIAIVDTRGVPLGLVRTPDAPIFGTDVALQKARTSAFFSGPRAAGDLAGAGGPNGADVASFGPATQSFVNNPAVLTGGFAITARAIGNIARPYFPDGEVGRPNGPLSRPFGQWSPFSTGLQSALIFGNLGQHVAYVLDASATDTPQRCTFLPDAVPATPGRNRLQNGIQIFPGSVPIYRGNVMVGAIGVSGDGIDQDDMISFLGLYNGGIRVGGIGNAANSMRSDRIVVNVGSGVRLRFVGCPFAPFVGSSDQNVCEGK